MRKTLNLILVITMGILVFPLNTFALKQDVGIKVKGDIAISAVTTISSDITIDVVNKTTDSAYIELQNKSSIPLSVKVTDIEALTNGAPSTFVGTDESLYNAGIEDTYSKIGFTIDKGLAMGEVATPILPDTEIDLGVVSAPDNIQGEGGPDYITQTLEDGTEFTFGPYEPYYRSYMMTGYDAPTYSEGSEIYKVSVNNGYSWTEGDLNFYYGITMVVGAATESYDSNPIPELGVDSVKVALLKNQISNSYIEVYFNGLSEENSIHSPSISSISYTDSDGETGTANLSYVGKKIQRETTWDEDTQSNVVVENGEVYGVSYFYEIEDLQGIYSAQKPWYLHYTFSFQTPELSEGFIFTDILTNKSLND